MLAGDDFDAVLVINCPTALAPSAEAAAAVAKTVQTARATRGGVAARPNPYSRFELGERERPKTPKPQFILFKFLIVFKL